MFNETSRGIYFISHKIYLQTKKVLSFLKATNRYKQLQTKQFSCNKYFSRLFTKLTNKTSKIDVDRMNIREQA